MFFFVGTGGPELAAPLVGAAALSLYRTAPKKTVKLNYPMEAGSVSSWDDWELIVRHAYKELKVDPETRAALVSTPSMGLSMADRAQIAEFMFVKLKVPALTLSSRAVLMANACSRPTSLVLDLGPFSISAVPIWNCLSVGSRFSLQKGYKDVVASLGISLGLGLVPPTSPPTPHSASSSSSSSTPPASVASVYFDEIEEAERDRLETFATENCCVAIGTEELKKTSSEASGQPSKTYRLSTGRDVAVGPALLSSAPELLFRSEEKSSGSGSGNNGVHNLVCRAINEHVVPLVLAEYTPRWPLTDKEAAQKALCQNIIVTGGGARFNGLAARLEKEIVALLPASLKSHVRVIVPNSYQTVWIGGSMTSAVAAQSSLNVTKKRYAEKGAAAFGDAYSF